MLKICSSLVSPMLVEHQMQVTTSHRSKCSHPFIRIAKYYLTSRNYLLHFDFLECCASINVTNIIYIVYYNLPIVGHEMRLRLVCFYRLSVCLSVCLSICLSVCLSVRLSVCLVFSARRLRNLLMKAFKDGCRMSLSDYRMTNRF